MSAPTLTRSTWAECRKANPCEACGSADGWCTRTADGLTVKCRRRSDGAYRTVNQKDGPAYLHIVADLGGVVRQHKPKDQAAKLAKAELEAMLKRFRTNLSARRLALAAKELRVSEAALRAYGLGLDDRTGWLSAPMVDGQLKPIGVHLRGESGAKKAVVGSQNGLFVPSDYDDRSHPEGVFADDAGPLLLLTPEGLTDCCAARDAGFRAVGRPSNNGGADLLAHLLLRVGAGRQDVVVMGEREPTRWLPSGEPIWPGIEGALSVCERLRRNQAAGRLRFAMPPEGAGKDLREWLTVHNAPVAEVTCVIREAKDCTATWLAKAREKLDRRKRQERRPPAA